MIIWINGPFGIGKTTVASMLALRIENSFVFDPEEVGFMIRQLTPPMQQLSDFQDYPLWRELVVKTMLHASLDAQTTIIVPMTLVNKQYRNEIFSSLHEHGKTIKHIALVASKEVILQRLKSRGDDEQSWPALQIDRCLEGLSQLNDAYRIDTTQVLIDEVLAGIEVSLDF